MDKLQEYKKFVQKALFKDFSTEYYLIALGGETGELMNEYKKSIRSDNGIITETRKKAITKELGDILFYYFAFIDKLNIPIEKIILENQNKINNRRNNK